MVKTMRYFVLGRRQSTINARQIARTSLLVKIEYHTPKKYIRSYEVIRQPTEPPRIYRGGSVVVDPVRL